MKQKKLEYYGTLGPSCIDKDILKQMFAWGMTGIRLNLSHGSLKDREEWLRIYQEASKECLPEADLLIDLVGPEIRIGDVNPPMELKEDENVFLGEGGIPVPAYILDIVKPGMQILLDDGKIELVVQQKEGIGEKEDILNMSGKDDSCTLDRKKAFCKVKRGGILHSRKSLALPGVKVDNPTLTEQDHENLKLAKEYGVTALMLPFVRGKEDLLCLQRALDEYGCSKIRIFAKIENMEGAGKVEELLPYCDTIVIARGDLGNAMPLSKLPVVQQQISAICRDNGKPFMVVTQMLNSMIETAVPTRAEVNDIFHAVTDGASSIMLTGETAAGKYPVEAMKVFVDTAEAALEYICQ